MNKIDLREFLNFAFELVKTVAAVFVVSFVIRTYVVQPFIIDGQSMEPNFHNNQFIMTAKASYHLHSPKRGDVIVFHSPYDYDVYFIKRIIGLPGETVEIKNGQVFIDSKVLDEKYIPENFKTYLTSSSETLKETVGNDEYFVLGDNRDNSYDSRYWGLLSRDKIVGKYWTTLPKSISTILAPISTKLPSQ